MEELRRSLNRSRDTAVGPDKIHYQFLKHLSESSLRVLLRAFKKTWQTRPVKLTFNKTCQIPSSFLLPIPSMSCLQVLDHLKIDHPIIEEIISKLTSLKPSGFDIRHCWLPGHVGIRGNERANRAAKTVHRTDMQPCLIPPSDFKPSCANISPLCGRTWPLLLILILLEH